MMKKLIMLMSVVVFMAFSGCNETVGPSGPIESKLLRIDYDNGGTVVSKRFEYQNDLLVKSEYDGVEVHEFAYVSGVLKTTNLNMPANNIQTRSEYSLNGDTLVVHHYSSVNHNLGNFIDTDGLMLQQRNERYWISATELREDMYFYEQGNATLTQYVIHTSQNGNVIKTRTEHLASGNSQESDVVTFFADAKNPEHFQPFGQKEFLLTNANIGKNASTQLTYNLNSNGYPTMVRSEYVNPATGQTQVDVSTYFYQ
ncbi:MAG: hypothetical protein Roseis2KO_19920 [Roseivirga sp.]